MRSKLAPAALFAALGAFHASANAGVGGLYSFENPGQPVRLAVDWCREQVSDEQQCPDLPAALAGYKKIDRDSIPRITPDQEVLTTVTNFNYFRYQLELGETVKALEGYQELAKLVDRLTAFGVASQTNRTFVERARAWKALLESSQKGLAEQMEKIPKDQMSVDRKLLGQMAFDVPAKLKNLEAARFDAFAAARNLDEMRFYETLLPQHENVVKSLSEYRTLLELVQSGKTFRIAGKDVGSFVTLSFVVSNSGGAVAGEAVTPVTYLVETKMPLIFHGGFSYTSLDDVEFTQVRSLSGDDLFQKVKDDSEDTGLTIFLGYPFATWDRAGKWQTLISLGTDFDEPGARLALGLSQSIWGRWMLTIGVNGEKQETGEGSTTETGAGGTRELFERLESSWETGYFFTLGARLY